MRDVGFDFGGYGIDLCGGEVFIGEGCVGGHCGCGCVDLGVDLRGCFVGVNREGIGMVVE